MVVEYNNTPFKNGFIMLFFYAAYQANCNNNIEVLNTVNNEFNNLEIIKINTTKYRELYSKYKIRVIPTYILLYNNVTLFKLEGVQSKKYLLQVMKQYIK